MNVQELIDELNKIEDKTLPVCTTEPHEYWGEVYNNVGTVRLNTNAQPDGPKQPSKPTIVLSF